MTRREAAESVFQYIRNNKFQPINIQYLDGYFIFGMGNDAVVHFDVKGLRGWKFAMWIETDPEKLKDDNGKTYSAIQFFCQHQLNIDKFKPSASYFSKEYCLDQVENPATYQYYRIVNIMQMIKRHPFVAFAMDSYQDNVCYESYIGCYLDARFYKIKKKAKEWIRDTWTATWHGFKVWFINRHKVVEKAELIDQNSDNWKCSPRYEMIIHFRKISDNEEDQEAAELKVMNRWFRKNNYKNMGIELFREGEEGRYMYE